MTVNDPLAVPDGVAVDAVDDLYSRSLEEFTGARNALSKQLRSDGEAQAAAWVKALSKPTAAAWAINQLARHERARISELRQAGAELTQLQEALLKGNADREDLQAAHQREREIVDELVAAAGANASGATADKVRDTLHAAALDEHLHDLLAAGRLAREQVAVGLGPLVAPGSGKGTGSAKPQSDKRQAAKRRARVTSLRKKLEQAQAREREQQQALEAAAEAAAGARRDLERAEREAEKAKAAVEKAEAAVAKAEAELSDP